MNLWIDRYFHPMLLKEIDEPFDSKDYIFELKFDGIRALLFVNKNNMNIISRSGKDITHLYPELLEIRKLVNCDTILDGEIIIMDKKGPSFSKLQMRNNLKDKTKILLESQMNPVIFVAFDILFKDKNLIDLKLKTRKEILNKMDDNEYFIKSKIYYENGKKLFKFVKEKNLEGIVAKKINSTYEINKRSSNWLKIKNIKDDDFIIGGYIKKKNGISLLLGEIVNNKLYYVGNVILTKNLVLYSDVLKEKIIETSPFDNFNKNNIFYIKPRLRCTVMYTEKTKNNHLRHPIIKR